MIEYPGAMEGVNDVDDAIRHACAAAETDNSTTDCTVATDGDHQAITLAGQPPAGILVLCLEYATVDPADSELEWRPIGPRGW